MITFKNFKLIENKNGFLTASVEMYESLDRTTHKLIIARDPDNKDEWYNPDTGQYISMKKNTLAKLSLHRAIRVFESKHKMLIDVIYVNTEKVKTELKEEEVNDELVALRQKIKELTTMIFLPLPVSLDKKDGLSNFEIITKRMSKLKSLAS